MMPEERHIPVAGGQLWTVRQGTGPPVLLCHGGPGLWDYLAPVAGMIDDLATVYRYDQRGCGRSSGGPPWTMDRAMEDIEALRRGWQSSTGLSSAIPSAHHSRSPTACSFLVRCARLAISRVRASTRPGTRPITRRRAAGLPLRNTRISKRGNSSTGTPLVRSDMPCFTSMLSVCGQAMWRTNAAPRSS